ncbi:MAG: CHAD domain-containing protein [Deltaproteobacteria bacterium]|nr:CHAD domain-containing protein [Deltaproteobacteria bacterium]
MMPNIVKFDLAGDDDERQISRQLATRHTIKKESPITGRLTIYDTFDWRFFNKSLVLFSSQGRLMLRKLGQDRIIYSHDIKPAPCFIWDFPEGDFKRYLEPVIKMRRLLKRADLVSRATPYRILNQDEKTVARLFFETVRQPGRKDSRTIAMQLWVKPVRGYPKYSRKINNQLEDLGLTSSGDEDIFFQAMRETGQDPNRYSTKLNIQLHPEMRSDEATKIILRFLFQVIKINAANIEQDLDTEFLHDYRVAVRRTRSALVWNKNIFPKKTIARFAKNFSYIGKISSALRDLDVYLLNQATYKAMLPPVLRDDIDPLFAYLNKQRSTSFRKVVRSMKSKKYRKIMQDWETFLNEPQEDLGAESDADSSVFDLARKRIYKQYKNVIKAGNLILENGDDDMLHKLRIQCKKLRYLIQFFSNLFPLKKINILVEQLKKLQDRLGDYNDLSVQVKYLYVVAEKLPSNRSQVKKTLVAIGSLIDKLDTKRQLEKESFDQTFTRFSSSQNQMLFRELFARKP